MPPSDDHDREPSKAPPATLDRVEYIVRPNDDTWLIEHAGDRYGPYKNSREAMFFAVDAARKLGALGKNTYVKMTDHAGHPLTPGITASIGTRRYSEGAFKRGRTRRAEYYCIINSVSGCAESGGRNIGIGEGSLQSRRRAGDGSWRSSWGHGAAAGWGAPRGR